MSKVHSVTTLSANTFDLPLYIAEIPQFDLSAALMQSLVKSVDFTTVNAARSLFKAVRSEIWEGDCKLDSMAELNSALNEQVFAETCFHEAGSNNTGFVETIQSLWPLREDWIDQARELTALTVDWQGNPRTFTPVDIEEQISNPVVNTSKKTVGRITRQVDRKAADLGIDDEDKAKTLANRLAREVRNNADMADSMKDYSGGVLHMLYAAIQADVEPEVTETMGEHRSRGGVCNRKAHIAGKPEFHLLPYALRFKLINDVIRTTELQAEWACKNNSMTDDDFDTFDMLCSKTIKTLRGILASPAFKVAMQQANATEHMTG